MGEGAQSTLGHRLARVRQNLDLLGNRPAIRYADPFDSFRRKSLTYAGLGDLVRGYLAQLSDAPRSPVGVYSQKTPEAYAALLACLFAGRPFVPLNPRFPPRRLAEIAQAAGLAEILTERGREAEATALGKLFVLPRAGTLEYRMPNEIAESEPAYILFTSGSTGLPKGVVVSRRALEMAVTALQAAVGPSERDCFSQIFDLSFDLSLGEILCALSCGASLCAIDALETPALATILAGEGVTVWGSSPSLVANLRSSGMLKAVRPIRIRYSLFCGELLHDFVASSWKAFAPESLIENYYGPTEAALYVTKFSWREGGGPEVPIGDPLPGVRIALVGTDGHPSSDEGELWIQGEQLADGYLGDPGGTAAAFVLGGGELAGRWYRTGDRARSGPGGFQFLGRVDNQVKVRGHRIELGEVESALHAGSPLGWVVIAAPLECGGADLVLWAFLLEPAGTDDEIARAMREARARLPAACVPVRVCAVTAWPLNTNGKVDRKAVAKLTSGGGARLLYPRGV